MVRWNDPRDLLKAGMGTTPDPEKKVQPAGTSDVLKALVPGQFAKKATNSATSKINAAVKGLKK